MEAQPKSDGFGLSKMISGGLVLIGIYAVIRYGAEWAYALGKLAGAN